MNSKTDTPSPQSGKNAPDPNAQSPGNSAPSKKIPRGNANKPRQTRKTRNGKKRNPDTSEKKDEKPKRTPQLHTDEEMRGMLAALQADYPGMSYKDIVKLALRLLCDKTAYTPPIRLARLDAETLRIQAGIAAAAEESAKRIIRAIIKAKLDPATQAKLIEELEQVVEALPEERRTMLRQAAIPMVPNLPDDVGVGIAALEFYILECPHRSLRRSGEACIQTLKAYRPPELDLPEDLRDPFDDLETDEPEDNPE